MLDTTLAKSMLYDFLLLLFLSNFRVNPNIKNLLKML
jgi:hypothetical protein